MTEKEIQQFSKLIEKFEKMNEQGRDIFCAYGDGILAAQRFCKTEDKQ